ncbi:hypothetical protein IAR55_003956 [Kwoniella newhampshirensis]|uniref:GATA-type domain-containing protein n=1 Tax=Kwoniella newhampshirensis TaxID=1651941 RepID=A0AAW0YYI2_9TREE
MSLPGTSLTINPNSFSLPIPSSDPTLNHLLSVPPLLALSPAHQALHLARLRLLFSIPASPLYSPASGGGVRMNAWCHLCGGLRQGMGGARGRSTTTATQGGDGVRKAHRSNIPTAGRDDGERDNEDEHGPPTIGASKKRKRTDPKCTTCGAVYERPKPDPATLAEFLPARKTRRIAKAEAQSLAEATSSIQTETTMASLVEAHMDDDKKSKLEKEKEIKAKVDSLAMKDIDIGFDPMNMTISPFQELGKQVASILGVATPTPSVSASSPTLTRIHTPDTTTSATSTVRRSELDTKSNHVPTIPSKPSPLQHRSLAHIPNSSPNLPTYPQPPPVRPVSPQGLGTKGKGVKSSSVGTTVGAGKKKKKSGLAKLLAENKEREEMTKGQGGMWGF